MAGASRFARDEAQLPDPLTDPRAFADAVIALCAQWRVGVLMPMSEEALLALLAQRHRMPHVRIPFASLEAFRRASDKEHVTALARTLGIDVPEQLVFRTRRDAEGAEREELRFPLVLKPARSVAGEESSRMRFGVSYVGDRPELDRLIAALPDSAFPVLVQRRIQGAGAGIFLLVWQGEVIARFAHRRLREKPPSGGVSVLAESVAMDEPALSQSRALLAALEWSGPAMVEFKQDARTGRFYLMEINGRFWGSLQLAVDAGVDFPALLVAAALGEGPTPVTTYVVGVRTRWWWGDVDHLLARFRRRAEARDSGTRAHAIRQFLFPGSLVKNEVLRGDDLGPFVRESIDWFRRR